jgi:elongation factor G
VRAATLAPEGGAVPLLCGSSYKNKGVQSLLDAVVAYLPSPLDRGACVGTDAKTGAAVAVQPTTGAPLRALAFKVQNDAAKGPLVFFRVYSGVLSGRPPLLNVGTGVKERPSKLLQVLADEQREVDAVACGHIAAATGLKSVRTGDTLVLGADPQPVQLQGLTLPQPVFTAALEVDSQSEQKALEEALAIMTREDPSLHAVTNEETGQLLLSGMGELHLDIAVDRLKREYGVPVRLGRMMVAYKEAPAAESIVVTQQYDRTLNKRHWVQLTLEVSRLTREEAAAVAEARSAGAIEVQGEVARKADKKARKGGKHSAKASESAPGAVAKGDSADADGAVEEEAEDAVPLLTVFENDESADSAHGRGGAAAGGGTGTTRQAQLVCRVLSESVAPGTSAEQVAAMAAASDTAGAAASAATAGSGAADESLKRMPGQLAEAVRAAVAAAVGRGPLMGYPLAGTKIRLVEEECVISPDTTPTAIRACINACVAAAFRDGGAELLEPVMAVEVSVPGASVGAITSDVTAQRRGRIREITTSQVQAQSAAGGATGGSGGSAASAVRRDKVIIRAHVPLRQMVGYSTQLRSQTAGEGGFSMQFSHYAPVGATLQAQLIADPMLA